MLSKLVYKAFRNMDEWAEIIDISNLSTTHFFIQKSSLEILVL